MASLGRLTIDMVANLAGFERDMGKADRVTQTTMRRVSRELNRAERDLERASASVRRLGLQLAALSAVAVVGIAREIRNMASEADRLDKLSRATGATVEQLQRLGFAAEQSGTNLETVARSITQLQRNIQGASDGLSTYTRAFDRIGVSVKDLQGLNPEQQFLKIAQALSEVGDAGTRNATALELFGRAGRDLLPLLAQGADGIQQLGDQFERTGAIISTQAAQDFARFNDQLNLLQKQAQALRVSVLSDLIGPLADFVEFLNTERGTQLMRDALDSLRIAAIALGGIIGARLAIQLGAASVAMISAAVNVARLTLAKQALTGSSVAATRAIVGLRFAISTLLGPVGIAAAVIASIAPSLIAMRNEFREAGQETDTFEERIRRLTQTANQFRIQELTAGIEETKQKLAEAAAEIEAAALRLREAEDKFRGGDIRAGASILQLAKEFDDAISKGKGLDETLALLNKRLAEATKQTEAAGDGVETMTRRVRRSTSDIDAFRRRMEDLADQLEGGNARAFREFTRRVTEASQLLNRGEISVSEYAEAVGLFQRQLAQATATELPHFVTWIDSITDSATRSRRELEEYIDAVRRLGLTIASGVTGFGFLTADQSVEVQDVMTRTFRDAALEGITDGVTLAFSRLSAQDALSMSFGDFGRLIGMSVLESVGGSLGEKLGEKFGESLVENFGETFGGALGQMIPIVGALIGRIIGGKLFGEKAPKFQVGGTGGGFGSTGAGRVDLGIDTALGETLFRFRDIDRQAQLQLRDALQSFDSALAGIIRDEGQLTQIADAIAKFGFDSADQGATLQDVLESRFTAIIQTFDMFTKSMVEAGVDLEDRFQRLADIIQVRARQVLGDGFGNGFGADGDAQIFVAQDLARPGETIAQAFQRLSDITATLNTGLALVSRGFEGGQIALAGFGDELQAVFGDDLQRLQGGLARIFGAFFSEDETLEQQIKESAKRAGDLLGQLGIDATGAALSEAGFRDIFDTLFGTLDAEATAILIEAGVAIADLIDAEEGLARLRGEEVDAVTNLTDRLRILQSIEETIALTPLNDFQRALIDIQRTLRQNVAGLSAAAQATGNQAQLERDLARAHEAAAVAAARAIAQLESATRGLVDQVFGTPLDAINSQIAALESQAGDAAGAIGGINTALANLIQFADSLLIGNLSPLGSRRRLEEGLSQLRQASASGDASRVQSLAQQVLQIGRERFASGGQFGSLFDEVQAIIRATGPSSEQVQSVSVVASPALEALFAERDRLVAEEAERNRRALSLDIAQNVADIAGATGDSFADVAERLGFDLEALGAILGFDLEELGGFLEGLQVDVDSVADALENVGNEIVATLDSNHQESVEIWRDNRDASRSVEAAVRELIETVRDGGGAGRSLRTRESIRP